MATEITFGNGNSITTEEYEPADLAKALGRQADRNKFAGDYLYVTTTAGEVWLNPMQVVYLRLSEG
ncbi:MAG: hypothetical protein ACJ757_10180 [Gaiellaceae bacterium]